MKTLLSALLIIAAVTGAVTAQRKNAAPKTVTKPAASAINKTAPPPAPELKILGVLVEKYSLNIEVNSDGTSVQTFETQMRLDSQVAINYFGKHQRVFNGDLTKVEVIDAYFLRKGAAAKTPVAPEAIQINLTPQAEAAPAFSSLKMLDIRFADLKVGDSVYFKYRLIHIKPNFPGHFDEFAVLPGVFEWVSAEITMSAPTSFALYTQAVGLEGGPLPDQDGKSRWRWHKGPVKALEVETAMLDGITPSSRLGITSFKSYDELGTAFWAMAESKANITPEIIELANRITKDISDPRQQASAIYEWVNKNIRYLLVFLDRGGWIPHDASQIVKNGYGDCKDYTILIKTLLKVKGIESYPVIIRSDMTDWVPDIALPSFFNHAILYIPSIDLFADATAPNTRLGLIPQAIVGKQGFLAGEKTGVIKTPGDRPGDSEILSDVVVTYAPDGGMKALSKNTYRGRNEILFRPMFAGGQSAAYSEFFVKTLLAYYGLEGTGRLSKVGNPFKVGEPFEVEMEVDLQSPSAFTAKGSIGLPIAVNLLNMIELGKFIVEEKRVTNLVVGASRMQENFILKFPESVKITVVPAPVNFVNAVGKFRSEFKIEGNSIRVTRELTVNKDILKPADYPGFRDLIRATVASSAEMTYVVDPLLQKAALSGTSAKPVVRKGPQSPTDLIDLMFREPKKLTAGEVKNTEALLVREPGNIEARKSLLAYYGNYETKQTAAIEKARLKHRIWFIQNRPEMSGYEVTGFFDLAKFSKDAVYDLLKAEWLKQVALHPRNSQIRLNAASLMEYVEPSAAISLLSEGEKIDPEEYEFPLKLAEIYASRSRSPKVEAASQRSYLTLTLEKGEQALSQIKKERSRARDRDRKKLLVNLSKVGLELKKYDRTRAFATELILDFGNDQDDFGYEEAAHKGNIVLGRIALAENDIAKAKEHLLIAIRAPLRSESVWLSDIDFDLARELLAKGEKDAILEYLRLCLSLREREKESVDLYKSEISALKSWQEQIKTGKVPSLDFDKP